LNKDTFYRLTQQKCFYCGMPPSAVKKKKGSYGYFVYNGVDRIDSLKGYTEDNVVACCKQCNRGKGQYTVEEFGNWIERVYLYWKHD
jgi:5-methylcytosine-specific restriction endonuclease McrA